MGAASEVSKINSIDVAAFLAGNDILLIPNDLKKAVKKMKRAFKQGQFTEERLAHSVKKILKAKYKVGLADFTPIPTKGIFEDINTARDDYLIHKSMGEAITLVKNDAVLPLKEKRYRWLFIFRRRKWGTFLSISKRRAHPSTANFYRGIFLLW